MTRAYEETRINLKTMEREHVANWSFTVYPGDNTHLTVCRDRIVKTVEVRESNEFVFRLLKTRIEAIGGANGIFKYIDNELFREASACFAWQVLKHCFFECRRAK